MILHLRCTVQWNHECKYPWCFVCLKNIINVELCRIDNCNSQHAFTLYISNLYVCNYQCLFICFTPSFPFFIWIVQVFLNVCKYMNLNILKSVLINKTLKNCLQIKRYGFIFSLIDVIVFNNSMEIKNCIFIFFTHT